MVFMTARIGGVEFKYFFDREAVEREVALKGKRWLGRVGSLVRKIARSRSILKKAPQKRISELTKEERRRYRIAQSMFKRGKRNSRPRRPERSAPRGEPPLLHVVPKFNPLRRIFYSYDPKRESVIVGPERFGEGVVHKIEAHNPFMTPALQLAEPRIAEIVRE